MKITKSYKIITLILTLFLSIACAFALMQGKSVHTVNADDVTPSTAFSSGKVENLKYEDGFLVKTITSDDATLYFNNKVALNDLEIKSDMIDGISKITITVETDSFFKIDNSNSAGVIDKDGKLNLSIKNIVVLDLKNNKVSLNGIEEDCSDFTTVRFNVENNVLSIIVGEATITNTDDYFTLYGKDKVSAKISYNFELDEVESAEYKIEYIDQGASEANRLYQQKFVLEDGNFEEIALPRVSLGESVIFDENGKLIMIDGRTYDFAIASASSSLSVLGSVETFRIGSVIPNNDGKGRYWLENNDTPDRIAFYLTDNADSDEFAIEIKGNKHGDTAIETYAIKVVKDSNDKTAPKYRELSTIESAIKAVSKKLNDSLRVPYNVDGKIITRYIRLGNTVTVPYMESLVVDDLSPANSTSLTHTIYYKTPASSTQTTTSNKITVSYAGNYQFYVLYKDEMGNVLDKEIIETALSNGISSEFIEAKDVKVKLVNYIDGVNLVEIDTDDDGNTDEIVPVFYFSVLDDAPIFVNAVGEQPKGYIGVEYNATPFDIVDSSVSASTLSDPAYTLYYNSNVNAGIDDEGWVSITALEKLTEGTAIGNLSYEDLKGIAYDGKLKFTPVKGAYYISCKVTSVKSDRFAEAKTNVIKIAEKPAQVKVDNHWLKNNVWSVVFLSIGTLCLVGIVVLLFTKPKDKAEEE